MKKTLPSSVEMNLEFDSYLWILQLLKLLSLIIGKRVFYQVTYKYRRGERLELKLVDLLNQNKLVFSSGHFSTQFDSINDPEKLDNELEKFAKEWRKDILPKLNTFQKEETQLFSVFGFTLLNISKFLYSVKNQKKVFEPIIADWQEEYFEALSKKEIWKTRWINVGYAYAFLTAMWQKSPIGDLIEFVRKLAVK